MPVNRILILRHGHRFPWMLDPATGEYTSNEPFPTNLPADPPLAPGGLVQAEEVACFLRRYLDEHVRNDRVRVYSSLFYRCLETLKPTVEAFATDGFDPLTGNKALLVRGEKGIGEWFGRAWFEQPKPADAGRLREEFYPWIDPAYASRVTPASHGEKMHDLHERAALALSQIIGDVDQEFRDAGRAGEDVTLLLSTHAAAVVACGRALTGQVPEDYNTRDFRCFTAGISEFVRGSVPERGRAYLADDWRHGAGVAGGWTCTRNSDCEHLSRGEQNGWHFQGDAKFDSYEAAAAMGIKTASGSVPY